jgi:hypothetical protein
MRCHGGAAMEYTDVFHCAVKRPRIRATRNSMANNVGSLEPSRQSLHRLAEHVLSPATRDRHAGPRPEGVGSAKRSNSAE